jgi:hypothetical protein
MQRITNPCKGFIKKPERTKKDYPQASKGIIGFKST